ncbi:MAG TPA: GNAT family N-acetyltransferase [Saprospiraceae bacterium]|nr:GNAT family N-acetyltransferase [Saprospiraceae bacterium]HNT22676.1 GNAT family N-acetyltransferase [Saprospiraceae bacterium]
MTAPSVALTFTSDPEILEDVLTLQRLNLRKFLSPEESAAQGFLYVEHDPVTLKSICRSEPAVVALDGKRLAAYALCMTREHGHSVPELFDFFNLVDSLHVEGRALADHGFLVCGQVCVAKEYRGQGLMTSLYHKMSEHRSKYYYCVTEISSRNTRSLHAHSKVGFVPIREHRHADGESWQIVLWDWNKIN